MTKKNQSPLMFKNTSAKGWVRWGTVMTLCGAVIFSVTLSSADNSEAEKRRTELYREGQQLAEKNRWQEAVEKFREVVKIRYAPKAAMALAFAEAKLGHLLTARELYRNVVADANAAGQSNESALAQEALGQVDAKIPRITLKVQGGQAIDKVTVDGQNAPVANSVVELDPGQHKLVISSRGNKDFTSPVALLEGARLTIEITFESETHGLPQPTTSASSASSIAAPVSSNAPKNTGEVTERKQSKPIGPIVLAGVGVIATGVGAYLTITGISDYNSALDKCGPDPNRCPRSVQADVTSGTDSARSKIIAGDITLGVGLATLAGAGIWWLVSPKTSSSSTVGKSFTLTADVPHSRVAAQWAW